MNARIIHVNIRHQPELFKVLMYALNSGTDYDGWHVSMNQELRNSEGQRVGEFKLRERDADY